jgi:long-chain acyl-CoA synthetase
MEKIWLKNYQPGIPATIEDQMEKYQSVPDILEESFKSFKGQKAFHCMGKDLTFSDIDPVSYTHLRAHET